METDQIAAVSEKKEMSAEEAVEFSLLFSILGAHGARGDTEAYRSALIGTFRDLLDGFGYKVVPKD